ncbi:MAG: hypothetical protein C5B59_18860 [Bacteroidetes bacterium]|nr:MAG: hypothetical protein C5B59_18860 [Bacteroidota bacterium]
MKELLDQYAIYNTWANARLLNLMETLDESKIHREIASSFNSLYKTAFHLFTATSIWFGRFQKQPYIEKDDPFQGSIASLSAGLQGIDQKWMDWVIEKDEVFLLQHWSYKNLKGVPCNDPVYQILVHIFNHATYHRGQMVTMLRELQIDAIPPTDFILWCRLQKEKKK